MVREILKTYLFFIICAFCGWIIESIYLSIKTKKLCNSGFLYGPFIPIYGFGALFIFLLEKKINFLVLPVRLLLYTFISTLFEYLVSYIFEKIFLIKLWDYSHEKFNFHGRVSLKFSFFWFILIGFNILFFQPFVFSLITKIDYYIILLITSLFSFYVIIDLLFSLKLYSKFSSIIHSFKIVDKIKEINISMKNKIKSFIIPLKHFPDLLKEVEDNKALFANNFIKNLEKDAENLYPFEKNLNNFSINTIENDKFFYNNYISIINNFEYQKLKNFNHHNKSSIYDHNIKVAWFSYKIGKKLKLRLAEIIKGALLHDFFFYDWKYEKPKTGKLHAFEHPKESLENALKYFSPLSSIEKDIILKHMWPLTIIPPRYIESFIVCIVDKIVASKEFLVKDK